MAHTGTKPFENSDEHYTPKHLFEQLNVIFDMDVAAPKGGVPWIPAKISFDSEINGLDQKWFGNVWMNPPYSKPTPWVDKFREHRNGIALLVVSSSKWFHALWQEADAIAITERNMKFERPDGHKKSIAFQTMLFAFGDHNVKALQNLNNRVR